MKTSNKTISPWFWVPTLYFAEGVPYFVVNNISVMMFTKMGVPNGDMAFFTTLLYFPWFLKGLWGPLVDVVKTKRWWILSMQVLMTALMILLTVTLPKPDVATIASGQPNQHVYHHADTVYHRGFCICHPRHRRRRLLYACPQSEQPGSLHRSAQHVLPHRIRIRTGRACLHCWLD